MSGPFAGFFKDVATPTPDKKDPFSDFFKQSSATSSHTEKNQGFLDYLGDFASSWYKTTAVEDKMDMEKMGMHIPYAPDEDAIKTQLIKAQNVRGAGIAMNDFKNFFGQMFKDTKDQLKKVLDNPGETLTQLKDNPVGFVGGFGKAFVTPIVDLAELNSGIHLTGDDFNVLTPEEKGDRIKSAVATGAMFGTGVEAGKAIKAGLAGLDALAGTESVIGNVSRLVPKGKLARKILSGSVEGGAAGTVYGLTRHANEQDQLSEALINGVMFAPLGIAADLALDSGIKGLKKAKDLSKLRQLQGETQSFADIPHVTNAFENADDLIDAVVRAQSSKGEPFIHIDGVPMETVGRMAGTLPEGYNMAHHLKGDDASILLYKDKNLVDKKFFAENGVAENQIVSHKGNDNYVVTGGDGTNIDLTNRFDASDHITVPRDEIRKTTRFQLERGPEGEGRSASGNRAKSITAYHGTDKAFDKINTPAYFAINRKDAESYSEVRAGKKFARKGTITLKNPAPVSVIREVGKEIAGYDDPTGNDYLSEPDPDLQEAINNALIKRGYDGAYLNDVNVMTGDEMPAVVVFDPKAIKLHPVEDIYKEWKGNVNAPEPTPRQLLEEQRQSAILKKAPQYIIEQLDDKIHKLDTGVNKDSPIGFDDTPPSDLLDKITDASLSDHIDAFLEQKGIDPAFRETIKHQLESRLRGEVVDAMPPEDRALVNGAKMTARALGMDETKLPSLESMKKMRASLADVEQVSRLARSNNMSVSDNGSGRIIIRDLQSKRILGGFDNYDEAIGFINKSGQADGPNMDGGGPISGDAIGGGNGLPPSHESEANDFPYKYNPPNQTRWEFLVRGLDNLRSITRIRDFITNVDARNETRLYTGSVEPLQRLLGTRNATMTPWIETIGKLDESAKKLSAAEREKIGEWLQTMTPEEVTQRFMSRPMNPLEVSLGKQVAESGVDLERIFPFIREVEQLDKEFEGIDDRREYDNLYNEARKAFGIDDKHMGTVGIFNTIKNMGKSDASLGAVVRLARSIMDQEVSRDQFARTHNLSAQQLKIGSSIEHVYKELADVFEIPAVSRLGGYMTHARLYTDGDLASAMNHFSGDLKAKDFFAKMARTGEISAFEKDPIRAAYRYIKAGFDEKTGLSEAMKDARTNVREEIRRLDPREQLRISETMERFFDNVRGFPAAEDTFAQAAVDHMFNRLQLNVTPAIRAQVVNTLLTISNAAMTGLRPIIGLKHLATALDIPIADRGIAYTSRVITQGVYAKMNPEVMEGIRRQGGISTISPLFNYSKEEFDQQASMSRRFARAAMKTNKFMFRATGTPDIFELFSAGHYLTAKGDALNAITKFKRGEMTWNQLKKQTFLDKFYQPIIDQFTRLVKGDDVEAAANLLGRETVNDLVGIFGDASHPVKWGTNWGRVLGQYGNIPLWFRSTVTRGLTRGTVGQRIAFGAKLAALGWATEATGRELGIDLSGLNPMRAIGYAGGPAIGLALDAANAIKSHGYTRAQAVRRLQKNLPIDPKTGRIEQSPFIPGSFAIQGLVNAMQELDQGNTLAAGAEALGFHKYTIRNQ